MMAGAKLVAFDFSKSLPACCVLCCVARMAPIGWYANDAPRTPSAPVRRGRNYRQRRDETRCGYGQIGLVIRGWLLCVSLGYLRRGSEVRRRVHLGRRVVALQGALEGGPAAGRVARLGLLHGLVAGGVVVLVLMLALLAPPDPKGNQGDTTQDDGTADAHDDSDDNIPGLGRHARRCALSAPVLQTGSRRCVGFGAGGLGAVFPCLGDYVGDCRNRVRGLVGLGI